MDNLESVEYMLYNGTTVKAEKGSDLFRAAQGAGSSSGILFSLTTKTWKPQYQNTINFTLALDGVGIDVGTNALMAIQGYALNEALDEFAIRSLTTAPPNTLELATSNSGLSNLSLLPASTIQMVARPLDDLFTSSL
jgi:hypothetical protein